MAVAGTTTTERHGIDPAFADEFSQKVIAAWNSHQLDQLLGLMTDDVVYDDASWPTEMWGHAALREFVESTWRAVPDLAFERVGGSLVDPAAPRMVGYWRATATHTGIWDPPGLAPTGRRLSFEGAAFYELREGKIRRAGVVYDVAGIMRQLGILPEARSRGERLIMTLTNLRMRLRRRWNRP